MPVCAHLGVDSQGFSARPAAQYHHYRVRTSCFFEGARESNPDGMPGYALGGGFSEDASDNFAEELRELSLRVRVAVRRGKERGLKPRSTPARAFELEVSD